MDTISVIRQSRLIPKRAEQLRAIYLDSFPPHERAEFPFLMDSIAVGERWLFAATRNGDLIGFAIIVPYVARDVQLLEYLAVAPEVRNGGIGSILLQHVVEANRAIGYISGILLEVETDDAENEEEQRLRKRRIAFYQRHGARLIESVPCYRVPLARGAGTMNMKLLWLPVDGVADAPRGAKLRECLVGIYTRSYGLQEEDALVRDVQQHCR